MSRPEPGLPNGLRGEVAFEAGGRRFVLRPSFEALIEIETRLETGRRKKRPRRERERRAIDWRGFLDFACGALGWRPAEFWAATPAELLAAAAGRRKALRPDRSTPPLDAAERERLAAMRTRFPDRGGRVSETVTRESAWPS